MTIAPSLRSYLVDGQSRLVVSAYDALTARIAQAAGFEVLHLSGYAVSATLAGVPDIGLITMTEMVEACRRVCESVELPVIADTDAGYGTPLAVQRTVRAFEAAGASAIHLEDQVEPKRCGHMAGKRVVPAAQMVAKISAAVDARRDDGLVVIARTDARAAEGLDSAIERAHLYRAAGADVLFVEAPESATEIERIARELPGPLLFNWAYDGLTPHVSRRWLADLGYALVLYVDVTLAVHRAVTEHFERLRNVDSLDEVSDDLTRFDQFNSFLGLENLRSKEALYDSTYDQDVQNGKGDQSRP